MFEDSILDSGGKGKKAGTVFFSTVIHFVLLGVLLLIPLIFTEQLEAAKYLMALTAPPPPPPPPPPPAASRRSIETCSGEACADRSGCDCGTD